MRTFNESVSSTRITSTLWHCADETPCTVVVVVGAVVVAEVVVDATEVDVVGEVVDEGGTVVVVVVDRPPVPQATNKSTVRRSVGRIEVSLVHGAGSHDGSEDLRGS